jgi:dephospho-CoA kinase
MRRVMIVGSSGAGKTTFARKLRESSRSPLVELDRFWEFPAKQRPVLQSAVPDPGRQARLWRLTNDGEADGLLAKLGTA